MEFMTILTHAVVLTVIIMYLFVTFLLWRSPLFKKANQPEKVESKEDEDEEEYNVVRYH